MEERSIIIRPISQLIRDKILPRSSYPKIFITKPQAVSKGLVRATITRWVKHCKEMIDLFHQELQVLRIMGRNLWIDSTLMRYIPVRVWLLTLKIIIKVTRQQKELEILEWIHIIIYMITSKVSFIIRLEQLTLSHLSREARPVDEI